MSDTGGVTARTAKNGDEGSVRCGDGWEVNVATGGRGPADTAVQCVVTAFGGTLKTLRVRAGLEREEFGRRIGYSASTVVSFEQERRIPSPKAIEPADEVLEADGLLTLWKEQVEERLRERVLGRLLLLHDVRRRRGRQGPAHRDRRGLPGTRCPTGPEPPRPAWCTPASPAGSTRPPRTSSARPSSGTRTTRPTRATT